MLTAYCLSYGNWTVIPRQWEECFGEMRDSGFDAVALSFSESEMMYARRTFEMQCNMARKMGLKVFVVPRRIGGRLAGAPWMPSPWLAAHPQAALPDHPMLANADSESFRRWSCDFIAQIMNDYRPDGVIWDEPKGTDLAVPTPEGLKRHDGVFGTDEACFSMADLIGLWTDVVHDIVPEAVVTLFCMPHTPDAFVRRMFAHPGVRYAGFDGGAALVSFFHEEPRKNKPFLWESWPRTVAACAEAGNCGSFALIENMLLPQSEHRNFEKNLSEFLAEAHPDHLGCYYYAHNNEAPEEAHELTMKIVQKYYLKR